MEEDKKEEEKKLEEEFEEELAYRKKEWISNTILALIIAILATAAFASIITMNIINQKKGQKFVASTYDVKKGEKTTATNAISEISDALTSFAEIIDQEYVGEIDKKTLTDETIKGFVKGLGDDYSEYMTTEEWSEYQQDALGNYSGVGVEIMQADNGYAIITNVIKDSPAEAAGVQQGDYIVGINGESVSGETTADISKKVKGETGTKVTLNILREGAENLLEFELERQTIRVYHVEGKMLEDDIGYIYFSTFDDGCAEEFEKETDNLVNQGAKKLILDLRYNTGGAVDQALKILDLFLEKGQIEVITNSADGTKVTIASETDKKYNFEEIVILMNKYTASASEIVTGAMIDNDLAKTVGEKSYGKGVMQSVFKLLDGSVLKLTTQEYNTPKGTKIHGVGITPDYEVELGENIEEDNQLEKAKAVIKGEE